MALKQDYGRERTLGGMRVERPRLTMKLIVGDCVSISLQLDKSHQENRIQCSDWTYLMAGGEDERYGRREGRAEQSSSPDVSRLGIPSAAVALPRAY